MLPSSARRKSRMPPQLEKNHVVPTAWQDEALACDGVSREDPCSALKGETVPDSLPAHGDLTSLAPHERLPEILVVPATRTKRNKRAAGACPTLSCAPQDEAGLTRKFETLI